MASRKWSIFPPQKGGKLSGLARKHLDEFADNYMNEAHENTVDFLEKKILRQKAKMEEDAVEIESLYAEIASLKRRSSVPG